MCVIRMAGARGLGQARWPEVEQVDRRPGPHPGECPVPASGLGNLNREGTGQEPESLLDTPLKQRKKVKSLSRVQLFVTPWTVAHQAPPSMEFPRQEYCSGLPFPSPGDLPDPGIKPLVFRIAGRQIHYHLSHQGSHYTCAIGPNTLADSKTLLSNFLPSGFQ